MIVVFEDSSAGIEAARSAGMAVIAVPNAQFPPTHEALQAASLVLNSLQELRPELVQRAVPGE